MADETDSDSHGEQGASASEPWFAKPNVDLLLYRIHRRPIGADASLFEPDPDFLAHLERVLAPSEPATSGHQYRRVWRLGSLNFNHDSGTFTGRLGWARSGEVLGQAWDADTHEWIDRWMPKDEAAVSPVAFSLEGRVLGVLRHPSFTTEAVLDDVLTQILNRGEQVSGFPDTQWSVEPLGDEGDFFSWLESVDQLLLLRMVFERPNPDGEPEFDELFDRLDRFHADQIKEEIRARNPEVGLRKEEVHNDPTTRGFLVAALHYAFGRVFARGKRHGRDVHYDQRQHVQRLSLDNVGSDWKTATRNVLNAVERKGREHGQDATRGGLLDGGREVEPL